MSSDIQSVRQLAVGLRDARIAAGLTQAELADQTGLSRPWINQFEQGKNTNASVGRILKLCRVLNVSCTISYNVPSSAESRDDMATVGETDADARGSERDEDQSAQSKSNAFGSGYVSLFSKSNQRSFQQAIERATQLWNLQDSLGQSVLNPSSEAMQSYLKSVESLLQRMSHSSDDSKNEPGSIFDALRSNDDSQDEETANGEDQNA
ncbi:transcriptional regulator, XRE family [Bifidobacterium goeldii]|uniref:Transcriptional regulator, XRE family n=1 Tax=Bifidobacterium goeldii TaxID=2306975 RepID=A0A430FG63_9BIFI|nr:helix-turn-helix transcriptional regulator [Bifidobacterium goeldii]RSX51771.1 transcriptional regulator, XRE family [Bifidobacterium goeldii]